MSQDDHHKSSRSLLNRPIVLVAAGFGLGYLARFLFGPPADELSDLSRQFKRPMPSAMPAIDVPLVGESEQEEPERRDDQQ